MHRQRDNDYQASHSDGVGHERFLCRGPGWLHHLLRRPTEKGIFMTDRRSSLRVFFVLCAFGVLSLLSMLSRPSLANIRAVDVVHLIGTGMCFGAGIVALVGYFHSKQG